MDMAYRMLAKTFEGLEDVLADELQQLGALNIQKQRRAVAFEGDIKLMYKANYWLRTAINVLKPIASFQVENEKELYDGIYAIKWFEYFDVGKTFSVDVVLVNSNINHSKYASYKVKDAISDQFRYYFNQYPEVNRQQADIYINVHIANNLCEVSLNSSGISLSDRAYRKPGQKAPINEVLAAGLIKLSGWDMNSHFIDPMCGTGTLLVEAALMAYRFPPAFLRSEFSFMKWTNYDRRIWRELLEENQDIQHDFEFKIIGSDLSAKNLKLAEEIIHRIKFHKDIELVNLDITDLTAPEGELKGWVITNPPYGERIETVDLIKLYKKIGDVIKQNFAGYKAWIISSDLEAIESIELSAYSNLPILNGSLECRYIGYEIPKADINKILVVDLNNEDQLEMENEEKENDFVNDSEIIPEVIHIDNKLFYDLFISEGNGKERQNDEDGVHYTDQESTEEVEKRIKDAKSEKSSYGRKSRDEKPSYKRDGTSSGEKTSYRKSGETRPYSSDRPSYRKSSEDKPYSSDRPAYKRSSDDKPASRERGSYGKSNDSKPHSSVRPARKDFGKDSKPSSNTRSYGRKNDDTKGKRNYKKRD